MRKITSVLCISILGVLLGAGTTLALPFTSISTGPERPLLGPGGILEGIYGLGNLERVDDESDQIWNTAPGDAQVASVAKYAGYDQNFGYIPQNSSSGFDIGDFVSLLTVPSDPSTITNPMPTEGKFVWALDPSGAPLWSSLQNENSDHLDHMVTYLITGGVGNTNGNYVLAWEDLNGGGDCDFNDLVVEVGGAAPVPEPATMLLFGTGLVGLAGARFRRKKK